MVELTVIAPTHSRKPAATRWRAPQEPRPARCGRLLSEMKRMPWPGT